MVNLTFLGAPGSGKGTYASRVAGQLGIPAISTGEILRQAVRSGTPLGNEVKAFVESGKLVPDDVMGRVLEARLKEADCAKGFILDGYPRTLPQAETLGKVLKSRNIALTWAIGIDVPEETIVKRLGGRRSCGKCGEVFNVHTLPPKKEGKCDKCGGDLVTRPDDLPETIRKRLQIYHEQSAPLAAFYRDLGLLQMINGNRPVDDVVKDVMAAAKRVKT